MKSYPALATLRISPSLVLLAIASLFAIPLDGLASHREGWTEDATAAVAKAKKENKDLLLLYTGSDWCPPCKKLEEEVFADEDFDLEASQHFVLVKFDFPKNTPQSESIAEQNKTWAQKFGVGGYPTVVLVDQNLKPFGIAGYQEGGAENYLAMLEEFRQARIVRDENMAKAEEAEGPERAKFLDQAISGIDENIASVYYEDVINEIVELDPDDALGLRSKWNEAKDAELRKLILSDILLVSRLEQPERAIQFIDEVLNEIKFPTDELLKVFQIKLNLVRKLDDTDSLDSLLDEMIALEGIEDETRERLIVKKVFLMVGTDRKPQAMTLLEQAINQPGGNLHLLLAKGTLLAREKKFQEAIQIYDSAFEAAVSMPDLMVELVGAKADAQMELDDYLGAVQTLDNFADDARFPSDLRSEALLHKAMIMRDTGRGRQARLAENRAIEVAESAAERAEISKMVARLRKKYEDQ